jgi:tRNA nucleotidyltransferase (CCA-adding enzyme)
VGSRGRDTFIAGDRDLDIFVFFPLRTTREELEKKGVALGRKVLAGHDPVVHYAEHPYVKGKIGDLAVEIVPCYRVRGKIISAVDRSPLHNEFVLRHLGAQQRDDVRLLKQFMKAAGFYGADTKTKGFSGYLCELLVIRYGGFMKFVKAAADWREGVVIDIRKLRKDYSRFAGYPLIVIDPVDAERNAAAAVSAQVFNGLISQCRQFLRSSSDEFFFPKPRKINLGAEAGKPAIMLAFGYPKGVIEEIVWSQLERLADTLANLLCGNGFAVRKTACWTDEKARCGILLELASLTIDAKAKHAGPPVTDAANCEAFRLKNQGSWAEAGRLWAWKKREFTSAKKALEAALAGKEIIPSHLKSVMKSAKLLEGKKMLAEPEVLEGLISRRK